MHGPKTDSLPKLSYTNLTVLGCCVRMLCFFNLSHVVVWNCPWIWNRENRMDWVECLYWCGHFPVLLHCDSQINTIGCQFLGQDEIGVLESVWISVIHKSVLGTPIFGKVFARVEVWMCFWCICRFVLFTVNKIITYGCLKIFIDFVYHCQWLLFFLCVCVCLNISNTYMFSVQFTWKITSVNIMISTQEAVHS